MSAIRPVAEAERDDFHITKQVFGPQREVPTPSTHWDEVATMEPIELVDILDGDQAGA